MKKGKRVRLSVEVEPGLHRRVKIAAAERDMTIKDYVVTALESVAAEEISRKEVEGGNADLAGLSAAAFGRDWESEEDSVYDDLR
jgi:predicted transcriptional regulator